MGNKNKKMRDYLQDIHFLPFSLRNNLGHTNIYITALGLKKKSEVSIQFVYSKILFCESNLQQMAGCNFRLRR